jgi:hypothetical protein
MERTTRCARLRWVRRCRWHGRLGRGGMQRLRRRRWSLRSYGLESWRPGDVAFKNVGMRWEKGCRGIYRWLSLAGGARVCLGHRIGRRPRCRARAGLLPEVRDDWQVGPTYQHPTAARQIPFRLGGASWAGPAIWPRPNRRPRPFLLFPIFLILSIF